MRRLIRFIRRHIRAILLALAAGLIAGGAFVYFWIFHDLPDLDDIERGMVLPATRIYDRHGTLLYEILPYGDDQGRHVAVALEDIPRHCQNAVIATEDANFYRHPGVDAAGILRALWLNLRGGDVVAGGSTITQQTARLLLLDFNQRSERTVRRKLREMVLAVRLESRYDKDEILALYLNQSYFGNLAYGIEGAARAYFGKSATDLSLAECALLAGMLQNPTAHDPFTRMESARARQSVVLHLMARADYITAEERDSALGDDLQFAASRFPIEAPHAVMAVWEQLERDFPEYVYGGGLEVVTTIDLNWTRTAERITRAQLQRINDPPPQTRAPANANNAALVALDPHTGEILTLLGSPDYFDETIDGAVNAALMARQPGSALKPFTYAAAMNPDLPDPLTAATVLNDVRTPFITRRMESYVPSNYGFVEHGPVSVREALAASYNIPAVIVLDRVGIEAMVSLAVNAGMQNLARNPRFDLSVTLGGGEVRLLDMTQAYSIFANGGHRVTPTLIRSVRTPDGTTLYEWHDPGLGERLIDERVASLITDILSDDAAREPSFGRYGWMSIGRPAAAKTGTTTDFRDNWIVGYTPQLVVGVWVGNADNAPMIDVTGVSGAGPIWHHFMRQALHGQPEIPFTPHPDLLRVEVCAISGLLPTSYCEQTRVEWFIPDTAPTEYDRVYQPFLIDRATGTLADDSTPPQNVVERVYLVLPEELHDWARRYGVRLPPPGRDAAHPVTFAAERDDVRVLSPDSFTTYQISPVVPIETQRLRLRAAAPSNTVVLTFTLEDAERGVVLHETLDSAPYDLWWPLATGRYQLQVSAVQADGTTHSADPVYFSVTDYDPPDASYTVEQRP